MAGGLRTFDDEPQLFLDVTGPDYPRIERFDVEVRATGDIPRARCLAGDEWGCPVLADMVYAAFLWPLCWSSSYCSGAIIPRAEWRRWVL